MFEYYVLDLLGKGSLGLRCIEAAGVWGSRLLRDSTRRGRSPNIIAVARILLQNVRPTANDEHAAAEGREEEQQLPWHRGGVMGRDAIFRVREEKAGPTASAIVAKARAG